MRSRCRLAKAVRYATDIATGMAVAHQSASSTAT